VSVGDRPGGIAVLDTNVLLHYFRMEQVRWTELLADTEVRIVVPVVVLDEIDNKRYAESRRIRERARRATDPLEDRRNELDRAGFAAVRDGVSVEYFIDPSARLPRGNPDEDLLDAIEFRAAAAGRKVTLVTADRGLIIRAAARRGRVLPVLMPDEYAKDRQEFGAEG